MPTRLFALAVLSIALLSLNAFVGCSSKPVVCTVSPIDIEETKSDSRDLDAELAETKKRLKKAQDELATWEKRVAERRAEIPVLQAELMKSKKMSGVTETMEVDVKPRTDQAQEIQLRPRGE